MKESWINEIIIAIKIFAYQKSFTSTKIWNKIKTVYKLLYNEQSI